MRFIKIFFFLSFLLIANNAISKDFYQVTAKQLNIRSTPDKNSSVVGSLSLGEKVLIDSIIQGWGRVIVENKIKGYASTSYLSKNFKDYSENSATRNSNGGSSSKKNGDSDLVIILIVLGIFAFVIYKAISYLSAVHQPTPK